MSCRILLEKGGATYTYRTPDTNTPPPPPMWGKVGVPSDPPTHVASITLLCTQHNIYAWSVHNRGQCVVYATTIYTLYMGVCVVQCILCDVKQQGWGFVDRVRAFLRLQHHTRLLLYFSIWAYIFFYLVVVVHAVTGLFGGRRFFCPVPFTTVVSSTFCPKIPKSLCNHFNSDIIKI